MASKRSASRTKVANPTPAPPQNRTRIVPSDSDHSNIQVVIRSRRRSEREIQENSPIIVSSDGAKSREISIETSAPQSSLGIVTLPPLRTYPFDIVFGPEADQAMIYHDVVSPMLEEVLMGYNCTLFAYGQTGTGKTYTMHGDLKPTAMGNPSPDAGMIPRVLFRLFHSLETSNADYSVKISYIELYNEELRDLLASDLAPPTGSTQPMGIGAKDKFEGLKLFDEAGKKGVFIQGLEEMAVKDCKDALRLLMKGSERRQIAATRFNDHSSRSHSIFSITVHVKETSHIGDDLLKVGKLNLVDLAGSENIGRSGAENKRAREAGMINQSLLTLGRVINALVDGAQHVPYRESKLTRLLQDSLGGRTKTCIIATISPARSNMEETLSTLDYALRAKSIRNKPEINQRMTRNGLLKEYIAEIERLKNDLLAAREKNGIFFSEDSWNQLNAEQELRQTELQESKKQIEIVESQMRAVREEFEQSIGLLMKRDEELKEIRGKLEKTEISLDRTKDQLQETKVALDEEIVVRKAYQETENNLNTVAEGLKNVAAESLRDIDSLFRKLERKSGVLAANTRTVTKCEETISSLTEIISKHLSELCRSVMEATTKLQTTAKEAGATELQQLSLRSQTINKQLGQIRDALSVIKDSNNIETETLQTAQTTLNEIQTTFKDELTAWDISLASMHSPLCDGLIHTHQKGMSALEEALSDTRAVLETILREIQQYIEDELTSLERAQLLANKMARDEIVHLRQQNEDLAQMLENEKLKAGKAKEKLMQQMSEMLDGFINEQGSRLQESVDILQVRNGEAEGALEAFALQHETLSGEILSNGEIARAMLQKQGSSAKRTWDDTFKVLATTRSAVEEEVHTLHDQVSTSIASHTAWVQQQMSSYAASTSQALTHHSEAKRARLDTTKTLGTSIQSHYGQLQDHLTSSSKSLEITFGAITAEASSLSETTSSYYNSLHDDLGSLRTANQHLVAQGARRDVPTGTTPQKRPRNYTAHWDLTQSRDVLLHTWRKGDVGGHISLPQEEDDVEGTTQLPTQIPVPVPIPRIPRSPTSSTPTITTPWDSPESQLSSTTASVQNPEPMHPLTKKSLAVNPPSVAPVAPLVDSRRKNIVTSRPSRRHFVR